MRHIRARRWIGLTIGTVAVLVLGVWLAAHPPARTAAPKAGGAVAAGSLDDLLMDLQLVPLDGQKAPPFALAGLDGRRHTLADLAGRPALLYFWATW